MPFLKSADVPQHTRALNPPLLAYVLNMEVQETEALLTDGLLISNDQQTVLELTEKVLLQAKQDRVHNLPLECSDLVTLQTLFFENGEAVLKGLRRTSGGGTVVWKTDDTVKSALAEICSDFYPFTLMPEPRDGLTFGRVEFPKIFHTTKLQNFISAVRSDSIIMKLFPDGAPSEFAQSTQYFTSFGQGESTNIAVLHENIIRAGSALASLKNDSSESGFIESAWEMLDVVRAILNNKTQTLMVFDIFDLVGLPAETRIDLNPPILRDIPKGLIRHMPATARPSIDEEGRILGGMLQRPCTFDVKLVPRSSFPTFKSDWPVEISLETNSTSRAVVPLATSMAIEVATAARWRATVTVDPFSGPRCSWSNPTSTLARSHIATPEECKRLNELMGTIGSKDTSSIEMAVKRYISATTGRDEPEDSLVDAVIGLESLFGGRAEIALSVASGVARLLGDNLESREELFKRAKDIYSARSALVHGNRDKIKKLDVPSLRLSAVELLKRSILTLLEQRDGLLPLSGSERVRKLVVE
ncbi:HEPN domain-containing protein [Pseudovibrio ascidiaceicola]|uniref:HEPN domain-containing protein n=1 Tax=Pseudovibrio ascidiaceicola TaxID=285279 RepID=UPI001114309B|nr:HEPN domain-containing protein [Pseudovibrio ascidiaceicola]